MEQLHKRFTDKQTGARHDREPWFANMMKAAHPWSDGTPPSDGGSRRVKDTPCSGRPHPCHARQSEHPFTSRSI